MVQKFKIPVYLILKSDSFDESNEATMLEYSFDENEALDRLEHIASEFAQDYNADVIIPEFCLDDSMYEVANYTFYLEERYIEV